VLRRHLLPVMLLALAVIGASVPNEGRASDRPLLRVDGADGRSVGFDRAALAALGPVTVETSTPWTDGVRRFVGAPLGAVLAAAGVTGERLRAHALNDYSAEMPVADTLARGAVLVWEMDGQALSVRDKGPLWILFDFDDEPAVRTDAYLARSVWQLNRISVE
jgi:hypothetical protein